jgi:hypothetical protein
MKSSPKKIHAERAKHRIAILVKEGIKAESLELKTKLNAVAKAEYLFEYTIFVSIRIIEYPNN